MDAKDIYLLNNLKNGSKELTLLDKTGKPNIRKYKNTLDFSLDLIKLREVYEKVYRNLKFSFFAGKKEYSPRVINVTFKYSVCEFNQYGVPVKDAPDDAKRYVSFGYNVRSLEFTDCICRGASGEIIGVDCGLPVSSPVADLPSCFELVDGKYAKKNFSTLVNTSELRKTLYEQGFDCDGIHYIRWKRSAGSSRVGKCLFIDEKLYPKMHKWEMCGLEYQENEAVDLAGLEAYISLPSSSIIDTIDLKPENILVIPDYESVFTDDIVSVEEKDGKLIAVEKTDTISNNIWDGQGFIDPSAMGQFSDKGMILLRNLFFKCCCFNCNIQQFFADHGVTEVSQLNGITRAQSISDIKLITTPSSIKYVKYGTVDEWLDNVPTSYGVVKYDKPTHYFDGRMVQSHYQLLNTVQMNREEVDAFLEDTYDFIRLLKSEPAVLRFFIKYPDEEFNLTNSLETKNDIVYKLLGLNDKFCRTQLYADFRDNLVKAFVKNLRMGHVFIEGNYSTLLGNPVEMLMQSIGQFDGSSQIGVGNVHTTRFDFDQTILASRSPHVTFSNVWLPTNRANPDVDRYFNLTDQIIAINSIGESVLDVLAGADFDSDTVMITNNSHLIRAAQKFEGKFKVSRNNVPSVKRKRKNNAEDKADLDIKTGNNLIGDIINLSQELNTLIWDMLYYGSSLEEVNSIYLDVCKLNVASNLEIDKAKKEFLINNSKELLELRKKYKRMDSDGKKIKPNFFAYKDKAKGYYNPDSTNYQKHHTTMDYLEESISSNIRMITKDLKDKGRLVVLPFSSIIDHSEYRFSKVCFDKVDYVFNVVENYRNEIRYEMSLKDKDSDRNIVHELILSRNEFIGSISLGVSTMIYLLDEMDKPERKHLKSIIFNTLFGYPNTKFFELVKNSSKEFSVLKENENGKINIFGKNYSFI